MLKTILSIAGRPGLFKLISHGKGMLIVEAISPDKKRSPAYASDRITSLADIAIYTETAEVPLKEVLVSIKTKEESKPLSFNYKKAKPEELREYMGEVLADFDRDRVHISDIKKLLSWYNILIENDLVDFDKEEETEEEE